MVRAQQSPAAWRWSSATSLSPPTVDDGDSPEFAEPAAQYADVLAYPPPGLPPDRGPAFERRIETGTHPSPSDAALLAGSALVAGATVAFLLDQGWIRPSWSALTQPICWSCWRCCTCSKRCGPTSSRSPPNCTWTMPACSGCCSSATSVIIRRVGLICGPNISTVLRTPWAAQPRRLPHTEALPRRFRPGVAHGLRRARALVAWRLGSSLRPSLARPPLPRSWPPVLLPSGPASCTPNSRPRRFPGRDSRSALV